MLLITFKRSFNLVSLTLLLGSLSFCAARQGQLPGEGAGFQEKPGVIYSLDANDNWVAQNLEEAETELVEEMPDDLGAVEQRSQSRTDNEVMADRMARRTFPLVRNEFVDQWIEYFTGRGRRHFAGWLERSTLYIQMMKETLREDGLPEDLIYLAMIESGFNTRAVSRAAAVGPWQFIRGTGNRYGMKVDYWIDERRDFIKSTHAAAKYLKELHQIFGTWYLAAAGYNAGEGRVLNAIRRDKTRNFWELARGTTNFRAETRNYVPKIIAAALIAKSPEQFGFQNLNFQQPLSWDSVEIPGGVSLRTVSQATGISLEQLRLLNPELLRMITPPSQEGALYAIRVPSGQRQRVLAQSERFKAEATEAFLVHRVGRGENLGAIARRYGSNVRTLMDFNNIRNANRIGVGQNLRIPVDHSRASSARRTAPARQRATSSGPSQYRVRRGDTWWGIARRHGISVQALQAANRASGNRLLAGALISIPAR